LTIPIEKIPITTINSKEYYDDLNAKKTSKVTNIAKKSSKDTNKNNQFLLSNSQELLSEIALNSLENGSSLINNDEIESNVTGEDTNIINEVSNKRTKKQPVIVNKITDDNKSAKKYRYNSRKDDSTLLTSSMSPIDVTNTTNTTSPSQVPMKISLSLDISSSPSGLSISSPNVQNIPISTNITEDDCPLSPKGIVNTPSAMNKSTTPGTIIRTLHDSDDEDNQTHGGKIYYLFSCNIFLIYFK
jgi:hypothetical protein